MAIFHYTVKIVGRSKGKSIISGALIQWKERVDDIRRNPGSHSHDGDNDKSDRGTAESYGRDGTGIAGTRSAAPVFSGAEQEFKKLKQRIADLKQQVEKTCNI